MRIKIYSTIVFLNSYITGVTVPVLSLLLMNKGASLSSLSVIMGIYAFTVIAFELPSGIMADIIGRKKTFLLSLVMSIVFSVIILLGHGFFILCVAILVNGLGRAISSGSFEALFIDSYINEYGKEKLHVVTAHLNVFDALGLSAGALTGGFLPEISKKYFSFIGIYDLNLMVKIILTLMVFLIALIFIKECNSKEITETISLKKHIKNSLNLIINSKNIVCIFISVFSTGFFLSSLETYWQPHFITLMGEKSLLALLGLMAFLYLISAMAGNIISSKIIGKYNSRKMYLVLRILLGFFLAFMALQMNIVLFIISYAMIYLIFGMANIPEGVILNQEIPNESRASLLSVNSLIMQMGMLIGSFLNSVVINHLSISELWLIASCLILTSIFLIYKRLISDETEEIV